MDEAAIISLAIEQASRARYRLLLANPAKRRRLLDKLNHQPPLDPRFTKWFRSFHHALAEVAVPSSTRVYLLSAAPRLDRRATTFGEAIVDVPAEGWGTIIGVSDQLALYYGEVGERAAVISRSAS